MKLKWLLTIVVIMSTIAIIGDEPKRKASQFTEGTNRVTVTNIYYRFDAAPPIPYVVTYFTETNIATIDTNLVLTINPGTIKERVTIDLRPLVRYYVDQKLRD